MFGLKNKSKTETSREPQTFGNSFRFWAWFFLFWIFSRNWLLRFYLNFVLISKDVRPHCYHLKLLPKNWFLADCYELLTVQINLSRCSNNENSLKPGGKRSGQSAMFPTNSFWQYPQWGFSQKYLLGWHSNAKTTSLAACFDFWSSLWTVQLPVTVRIPKAIENWIIIIKRRD